MAELNIGLKNFRSYVVPSANSILLGVDYLIVIGGLLESGIFRRPKSFVLDRC